MENRCTTSSFQFDVRKIMWNFEIELVYIWCLISLKKSINFRVAPIWKKFSDFKSGLRIFVVWHKDTKNTLELIVAWKPRSRRVPEGIAQFFTDYDSPIQRPRKLSDSVKLAKNEFMSATTSTTWPKLQFWQSISKTRLVITNSAKDLGSPNEGISLNIEFFYLKKLLSLNFCQKCMKINSFTLHTVIATSRA